jgi:truncated hemoglobin YjbI
MFNLTPTRKCPSFEVLGSKTIDELVTSFYERMATDGAMTLGLERMSI